VDDRDRVLREIRRNAALIVGCNADDVEVVIEASPSRTAANTTFRAVAHADGKEFQCRGDDEDEAIAELLDLVVDGANAEGVARRLVMAPELQGAFRLLQLTRRELIAELRASTAVSTCPACGEDAAGPQVP